MARISLILFLILSTSLAYYGMWELGRQNGFREHAVKACASGTVRTHYTGLDQIDHVLCVMVSILEAGTSLSQVGPFSTVFLTLFSVPLLIMNLEAQLPSTPLLLRVSALPFSAITQVAGAGLALPIWYILWVAGGGKVGPSTGAQPRRLKTIAPALWLALYLPAMAMTTTYLTQDQRYIVNALFQIFPFTFVLYRFVLGFLFGSTQSSPAQVKRSTLNTFILVNTLMYFTALSDLYSLSQTFGTSPLSVLKSIIPSTLHPTSFAETAHLFLLVDAASVLVSSFAFVWAAPGPLAGRWIELGKTALLTPIIGPGAALLLAWKNRGSVADRDVKGKKKA